MGIIFFFAVAAGIYQTFYPKIYWADFITMPKLLSFSAKNDELEAFNS